MKPQFMKAAVHKRIPDHSRLTRAELGALLNLHRAGKNQVEIAHILGVDQSNVSRWLDKLIDTTEIAKHTLKAGADKLAQRIISKANVEESLEVLDRLDVAPKRQTDQNRANNVNIVIGMPNQPAGLDPFPVNIIATYQTQSLSEGQHTEALTATHSQETEAKGPGESV